MQKIDEMVGELQEMLSDIELDVLTSYTLADAIREGCKVSDQAYSWGDGDNICSLSAAAVAAKSRGYIE